MKQLSATPHQQLQRWFWLLLLANILFIVIAGILLRPFTSGDIIKFEVAKKVSVALSIMQDWKLSGKFDNAIWSIYADYLFIVLYTTGLAVACTYLAKLTKHVVLIRAAKFFSYLLIIAGICDVIENSLMLKSLHGNINSWNVVLAYDMAATKFSIIIVSLLLIVVCLLIWLLEKIVKLKP